MTSPPTGQAAQPSPAIMSRLAFVRLFFLQGIDQSRQPEPLDVSSVLTLHDTVELFLQVIAEYRGVKLSRFVQFHEYWKLLDPAKDPNGVALSGERPMIRLNDLRTAFKHYGTLPSAAAIAQACTDVPAFLEANTLTVFGMPFDTIDMAEVIPQAGVRDKVRAATAAAADGDLTEAMGLLAEAYDELFGIPGPVVPSGVPHFGDTIRPIRESDIAAALQPAPGDHTRRPVGANPHHLASAIGNLMEATREMQLAMRVMALGIDYRQYAHFKQLTPSIVYFVADLHGERRSRPGYAPTDAEFEFCRQFVITAALRIAEEP